MLDDCSVCEGDNSSCTDECGVINGNGPNQYQDCDGNCLNDEDNDNICDEIDDCVGIWVEDITSGSCYDFEDQSSCTAVALFRQQYVWPIEPGKVTESTSFQ